MSETTSAAQSPDTLHRLSKRDLLKLYIYSQAFVSGFNYEKQEAPGTVFSLIPVIEKVYDNEEEKVEAYRRHTELFLTEAHLSHLILGITAAMEEEQALKHDIDPASIGAIKSALMGPFAGIGDSLYHGTLRPIMAGLAVSLITASGYTSPMGAILFVLVMAGVGQALRYLGIMYGYKQGVSLVAKIQSSGLLQKLTKYASIAACVVIGGFVSNLVAMNLALSYSAGETVVSLQETLDGMMPSMLPLALTLLCFWLIDKKKVNPVPLMFAVMIVGVLGSMAGILA